jgi:hypothetical protein
MRIQWKIALARMHAANTAATEKRSRGSLPVLPHAKSSGIT